MLWHIGNTTVRSPYRLRDALRVLRGSEFNGNLSGRPQENAFAELLHNKEVLHAPRVQSGQDASDLGRKWRSALTQLGFITSKLTSRLSAGAVDPNLLPISNSIELLSGRPHEITPNGYRLIEANVVTAQQESFLRALVSYRIPSVLEKKNRKEIAPFSPLQFVLKILHGLDSMGGQGKLSFQEFAFFVQTASPEDDLEKIVDSILSFRKMKIRNKGSVKNFERKYYVEISSRLDIEPGTLNDYADLSIRYLKATGLFQASGKGITVHPSRVRMADLLSSIEVADTPDEQYLLSMWMGAKLPTDNKENSYFVVQGLIQNLEEKGQEVPHVSSETPYEEIEKFRHELEHQSQQLAEIEYAKQQSERVDEICTWIEAITKKRQARTQEGEYITVPKGEMPAYLEWIIWRSFLAINSLRNEPWECRRFNIDQDFLPISCAPGGGPDMIFEFANAIIVVEVTLTSSSRQEAAEGEPVRRHVAKYVEESQKPVYGLFLATSIDSNTAHTFRSGDWYLKDDKKIALDIVPMTLSDFSKFLMSGKKNLSNMPSRLEALLIQCRAKANQEAPNWKQTISTLIEQHSCK